MKRTARCSCSSPTRSTERAFWSWRNEKICERSLKHDDGCQSIKAVEDAFSQPGWKGFRFDEMRVQWVSRRLVTSKYSCTGNSQPDADNRRPDALLKRRRTASRDRAGPEPRFFAARHGRRH